MANPTQRPSTLHAVSRALGLPAQWLREEANSGRIPCLRAGDRFLFDLELVRKIVNDRARNGERQHSESSDAGQEVNR
jgi:hypothetical protein